MVLPPTRLTAFWRHSMRSFVIWSQHLFCVSAYQSHLTIAVNIACRATFDSYHTELLLHKCWHIMSGIFCKALQSNPFLAGNTLQYKTGVTLAASTHSRFSSHLLLSVRHCQKAGQVEHRRFCHVVLWCLATGEKWFFLRGRCNPRPKLTTQVHNRWKVHNCSPLL